MQFLLKKQKKKHELLILFFFFFVFFFKLIIKEIHSFNSLNAIHCVSMIILHYIVVIIGSCIFILDRARGPEVAKLVPIAKQ